MLYRDYHWLVIGTKPTAMVSVRPLPFGSINAWFDVPLSALYGSMFLYGDDIGVPIHAVNLSPIIGNTYFVFGSYANGSYLLPITVDIAATDNYIVLPYGAAMALASPALTALNVGTNVLTIEAVLGRLRELNLILGTDYLNRMCVLSVKNWINFLSVQLELGDYIFWSNRVMPTGQGYNTSIYYTPLKFTVLFGQNFASFPIASSFSNGTAIFHGSVEQVLVIAGLTEQALCFTFPNWFKSLWFGSVWVKTIDFQTSNDESWFRLWAHQPSAFGSRLFISKPFPEATWIRSHTKVYEASLLSFAGSLGLQWSSKALPIISKLVIGTTVYFNATPFTYQAPIQHVSYSAELTADFITSSGRVELTPFRLTDFSTYRWVAYPLSQYIVALPSLGTLFVGARVGHSTQTERNVIRVSIELADNQSLLKRMTVDSPVIYDYYDSERAARDFLNRFGLAFWRHGSAANLPLLPEFYGERRTNFAWSPRIGETALDFFNKIATLNGWRIDWTEIGTVKAYPKWDLIGTTWIAYWPTPDQAFMIADLLVARLNVNISDYERRNILVLYGIDAFTNFDVIKIFADIEAFAVPWSDRFMPIAVPAFVRFDKPIPAVWMDSVGNWISKRLFITPFQIQFTTPLFLKIRPGDEILFVNENPMNFHRYRFLVTQVQHEIGREYSTVISAHAYKEVQT